MFPVYAGTPTIPHDANAMWIEPQAINLNTGAHDIGYKFNVSVWLNVSTVPSTNQVVGAWQSVVAYQSAYLDALNTGYTAGSRSQFFENISAYAPPGAPSYGTLGGGWDYVMHGESWLSGAKRVMGYGSLNWIEFNVTAAPPKGGNITSLIRVINTGTPRSKIVDDTGGEASFTPDDADYVFVWSTPPSPKLAVDPTYKEYDVFTKANCSLFNVTIWLKDLASAWYLVNTSFCLCYNSTLIETIDANITLNPDGVWDIVTGTVTTPGEIDFYAENTCGTPPLSGNVRIAIVQFHVKYQGTVPPRAPFDYDESKLSFCRVAAKDHTLTITPILVNGTVRIYCLMELPIAYFKVVPKDTVLGPDPSIGKQFDINVTIEGLHEKWYVVGFEFRLSFCPTLLKLVSVTEGPFLKKGPWNKFGTVFFSKEFEENMFPHHVAVGGMLLPNATGQYNQTAFPSTPPPAPATTTLATIRFEAIAQSYPHNYSCNLDILPFWPPADYHLIDKAGKWVPTNMTAMQNGTYKMTTLFPGERIIDVFTQYPKPYGGQGQRMPSDMFWPQKEVFLYANVSYNWWPVQQKIVSYEVQDPTGKIWLKDTAITNEYGQALLRFRIPWPCQNPEQLFGKWKVTATVDIACIVVNDTLYFDFQYAAKIWSITVDQPDREYNHCEYVNITVTYGTKRMQPIPLLIVAVIYDNLGVPIGVAMINKTIGHNQYLFCQYKNYTDLLRIHIEKFAFAGAARVVVNLFDKDPTEGGMAWCPSKETTIYIQPY